MTSDDMRETPRQKLKIQWHEYSAEVLRCSPEGIFERTDAIAAVRFCFNQLTENLASCPAEYPEYLLRFENPLSVVQDQWAWKQNAGHSEEFEHALLCYGMLGMQKMTILWILSGNQSISAPPPAGPRKKSRFAGPAEMSQAFERYNCHSPYFLIE